MTTGLPEGTKKPKCQSCERPATCFGTYEDITGYGCDECCGHGNEDGECEPLRDHAVTEPQS